jgi:hypothetical protein
MLCDTPWKSQQTPNWLPWPSRISVSLRPKRNRQESGYDCRKEHALWTAKNRKLRNELTYPLLIQGDDHFGRFNFVVLEAAKQDFSA